MSWKNDIKTKTLWNGISLSNTTIQKRGQLRAVMDQFTTFTWRGFDAFDSFGAFIINGGDDLQFYNGSSFSNEYTQPQFETGQSHLMGVTFKTQTISFKIGVYWISEEDYRQFMNWLHPYEINYLSFGFDKNYAYLVKLSSRSDSVRRVVGYEGTTPTTGFHNKSYSNLPHDSFPSRPMYYTEMSLEFEVQGAACAMGQRPYEWQGGKKYSGVNTVWGADGNNGTTNDYLFYSHINQVSDMIESDLETPIEVVCKFDLAAFSDISSSIGVIVELSAHYNNMSATLFNVELQNLNISSLISSFSSNTANTAIGLSNAIAQRAVGQTGVQSDTKYRVNNETLAKDNLLSYSNPLDSANYVNVLGLRYESESGLLFLQYGSSKEKLLNLLNTSSTGEKIVTNYNIRKFYIPGKFDVPGFNYDNFYLQLSIKNANESEQKIDLGEFFNKADRAYDNYITAYPRTNLI